MSGDDKSDVRNTSKSSLVNLIVPVKDLVALLRDCGLFVLVLLLLVFPMTFNSVLTRAGFEEGSLVGFKWKSKLVESDQALKEARATITDLKTQLSKTSQALADAQAKLNDPSLKETLVSLEKENKQLNATSSRVETSVANTIASSAPLVEKAQ